MSGGISILLLKKLMSTFSHFQCEAPDKSLHLFKNTAQMGFCAHLVSPMNLPPEGPSGQDQFLTIKVASGVWIHRRISASHVVYI